MLRKVLIIATISILSLSFVLTAGEGRRKSKGKQMQKGHGGGHHGGGHGQGGGAQSPYNLRQVMQHLGKAQEQIHLGLLMNNRLLIKTGAEAIGHHPRPKGGIKPYVTKKMDMKSVKGTITAMDKIVHDGALEIAKKSETASMIELNQLNNRMVVGCISCHNVFRD